MALSRRWAKVLLPCAFVAATFAIAHAMGVGKEGASLGKLGVIGKTQIVVIGPTGKLLAADGVSFILSSDGTSKICRAGGC